MSNVISITQGRDQTMTSKEMADLTEKRHDSVKRTIDTLAEKGVIYQPQIVDGEKSANGVVEKLYRICKRDSYVIVAQLSPEFTARLVDRWQELEAVAKKPEFELPNFSNPAIAARAWADQVELKLVAEEAIRLSAPKVELVDNFLATSNGKTGGVVAKELAKEFDIGRNRLYAILQSEGVFDRDNVPSQRHVDLGRFYMQTSVYETEDGPRQGSSVRFTAKGEFFVRALLLRLRTKELKTA